MGSYSDSTSDLDEDFPVYDFLQRGPCSARAPSQAVKPALVDLDSSDTEVASSYSPAPAVRGGAEGSASAGVGGAEGSASAGVGGPGVMMISSDSEGEDAPYVPLALRLKQRQGSVAAVSSAGSDKDPEGRPSPDLPGPGFTARGGFSESEPLLLGFRQAQGRPEERGTTAKPSSWAGSAHTSPAKRQPAKRTAEEILASREEALRRRGGAGQGRQPGDKEAHRLEQERQKAERKALADAAKALRPDECIKHMVVVVDPALLQVEGGGTLLTSVQELGCHCAIEKQPLPRTVSWIRRSPCPQTGEVVSVPEDHVVIQMTVEDFIALIHSYTQEQRGGAYCGPTLTSWVQDLQARSPDKTLSLVVVDLEKYFRSNKSQKQKKFRGAVLGEEPDAGAAKKRRKKVTADELPEVTRIDVEEATVNLQLHCGAAVRFLSTWKDFSQHIVMTTRAVAEAPFKREREKTGFSFYLESDWAGGQRVDRAGKGLLQVWKRQIQQLNRVSPDMASAILSAYPSPQLLIKAYRRCSTGSERTSLLSDLLIRRGEGVTSTTRRVGPELSKRLCLAMTSPDPEQALDLTA